MIIIGELINGMYKDVTRAIQNREADLIEHLAIDQIKAGSTVLDVSTGPYSAKPLEDMLWLINVIQKVSDISLSIDSTKPEVMVEALKIVKKQAIINSTSADDDKMSFLFELAKKYNTKIIALTMDRSGVPATKDKRLELAAKILEKASACDIACEDLFIDPIAMPVNVAQPQCIEVIETIREFRLLSNPAPQTVIGLSNVSQGARSRSLLNRTFLVMALANGLTSAILDPLDKKLMDAMIAAELLLNKNIYCDSFLDAYRKK